MIQRNAPAWTLSLASMFSTISGPLQRQLQATFPAALWAGDATRRAVALTFDDGPVDEQTPALLAVLDKLNIQATFFVLGSQAEAQPQLVRQIAAAGHQIGIHGYEHRAFPLLGEGTLHAHLVHTQAVIADAAGRAPEAIAYVRPPYGVVVPATLEALCKWHFRPVMWSLVPMHWSQSLEATITQVHEKVTNGTLLVLHEGLKGPTAAEMAQRILPHLQEAGYDFITIDTMWHDVMPPDAADAINADDAPLEADATDQT